MRALLKDSFVATTASVNCKFLFMELNVEQTNNERLLI
jgi:hypothetical protein